MGLTPLMLFTTVLLVVRNQRILTAWNTRQQDNERRAAKGLLFSAVHGVHEGVVQRGRGW